MKGFPGILILTFVIIIFSGCAAEQYSRNVYEGAKIHDESLKSTPLEKSTGESISYDQYERERQSTSAGWK
jgi:hypothetical protein